MPCTSIATRSPEAVFLSFSLLRLSPLVPVCFCPPRAIFFKATLLLTAALLSSETLPLPLHQFLNLRLEFGARRYQPIWEKVQVWVSTEREVMGGCKVKGRYSERQRACVVWVSLSLLSLSLPLPLSHPLRLTLEIQMTRSFWNTTQTLMGGKERLECSCPTLLHVSSCLLGTKETLNQHLFTDYNDPLAVNATQSRATLRWHNLGRCS